jgi:trimethylamine---corrinoid protein Co-methyltransferase
VSTELIEPARRNRRDSVRRSSSASVLAQSQPGVQHRRFPPTKIISDDEVEAIHKASLQVLSEIGMDFMLPEALDLLAKSGGCKIDGERVRFEPAFIEETMRHAPSQFVLNARNPAKSFTVGGPNIAFGTVGSPPSCHDVDSGRRTGNREDFRKFLKLGQYFNCIDFCTHLSAIWRHSGMWRR